MGDATCTLTVDGAEFPLDLAGFTAEHDAELHADLGVDLRSIVDRMGEVPLALVEVVALMVVSLRQRDLPADHRWLARHVTMASSMEVTYEVPDDAAELTPELVEAARSVLARAEAMGD